jgi:hypothetical protein
MARRILISSLLLLVSSALVARSLVAAAALRADAPFVALATGHADQAYSDTTADVFQGAYPAAQAPFTNYRVVSGTLPAGLVIDPATGLVSGTPLVARDAKLRLAATDKSGADYFVRGEVAVFSKNEQEIVPNQSFLNKGPFAVTQRNVNFNWQSSYDNQSYPALGMIFQPTGTTGKLPLLVLHRGRGFTHDNYVDLLTHIASYGFVCASISDSQSFYDPSNTAVLNGTYDGNTGLYDEGMQSGSASQEGMMDYVLGLAATPGDALFGVVDNENIFISGHSRGGGATQASHQRSFALHLKGVVYFMAFDLRESNQSKAPTTAPLYPIDDKAPRLPSLIISAENDGDLSYPFADEFIDRATGPTTFVTIYGATHQDMTDTETDDGTSRIGRTAEQNEVANLVVAFMKRWSSQDVSLDGFLYGRELATSSAYGVASWRRTSPMVYVDDFQSANPAQNLLGGPNTVTGATRTEASVYPALGDLGSLGIQHSIFQFTAANAEFDQDLSDPRDLRRNKSFLVRVKQEGSQGFQVDAWVVLTDAHGNKASLQFAQKSGQGLGFLPGYSAGGSPLSRFITLNIPLYLFERAGPAIDLGAISKVSFVFGATPGTTPEFTIDDVRFE